MLQKTVKLAIATPFALATIVGFVIGCVAIYEHFESSESREIVNRASITNDPAGMELSAGANNYIRRTTLPDSTETGIIRLSDGSEVKYWFRSHHLSDDLGTSKFRFPDGSERTISGYFCCEVMFSQEEFRSSADLDSFLTKIDGTSP
jgi:hypothetical protein